VTTVVVMDRAQEDGEYPVVVRSKLIIRSLKPCLTQSEIQDD